MSTQTDTWRIGDTTLHSRFLLGTAGYPSPQTLRDAIHASGSQVLTLGLKRTLAVPGGGDNGFVQIIRDTAESMALKHVHGAVIIAGSGMCTGGRIRHHLRHNLWRKEAAVVFVGYAAQGTLARQIIDGAEEVRVLQEYVEVNARIYTIGGFSAHADQEELLSWHARTGNPERTFLVHGEETAMATLAGLLGQTQVLMPSLHESFAL